MPALITRLSTSLSVAMLLLAVCHGKAAAQDNAEQAQSVSQARSNYQNARDAYKSIKRLAASGSVSQSELRQARLDLSLAGIALSDVREPRQRGYNRILRATAIYRYRDQEYKIKKRLYARGAVSEVAYRRAVSARQVAKLNLQATRAPTEVKQQLKQIEATAARLSLVEKEHAIAERLLNSGSMSQSGFDRVTQRLEDAKEAHAASKRNLSVRAVHVET